MAAREIQTKQQLQSMRELFGKLKPEIERVATRYLAADRVINVFMAAMSRQPGLLECTQASLAQCVRQAAELGLELNGVSGEAYAVPFKNKATGRTEAQFIPGYKGYIKVALRHPDLAWIEPQLVYENDKFRIAYGGAPAIEHEVCTRGPRGAVIGAYALARHVNPDIPPLVEWMSVDELNLVRRRSRAADKGPWVTDTEQMQRKCPVRRLYKLLPRTDEMNRILEVDADIQGGEVIDITDASGPQPQPATSRTQELKQRIAAGAEPDASDPDAEARAELDRIMPDNPDAA